MDISSVGIIPTSSIAPMTDRAGGSHLVRRVEPFVNVADIGSKSKVIALVVDCVGSKSEVIALVVDCVGSKDVLNVMEAVVDIARIGGKPSGVTLIVDCARSTKVVDGVKPTVGNIFANIIILAVVSIGSGEATQGAQGTVESIMSSVVASAIDWSSGGAERVKTLIDRITAEPRSLDTGITLVVDHDFGAGEGSGLCFFTGGQCSAFVFFLSLTRAQLQNPACAELCWASVRPSLQEGVQKGVRVC